MKKTKMKHSWNDRIFTFIVYLVVTLLTVLCIAPFLHLLAVSVSGTEAVLRGEVFLVPKDFSMEVYHTIIENGTLVKSMFRTIILTVIYVIVAMIVTIMCAYPLSEPGLKGKKFLVPIIMFTMYFSGGLIPGYLLINALGLIDSYWSLILPCAISTYNMIVLRSFFSSVPVALREAAFIDGAGDFTILTKVILPLSKPALATITLFYAVSRWNTMQDALLYISDPSKAVLQVRLKQMIQNSSAINELLEGASASVATPVQTARAGAMMFSLIPIIVIYPFLQKYFVKGTMIGSVKG